MDRIGHRMSPAEYVFMFKFMHWNWWFMERDAISFHEWDIQISKNYHRISRQGLIGNPFGQRHGSQRRRWKSQISSYDRMSESES